MNAQWLTLEQLLQHCLCPPGDGVYALSTGKARKASLQSLLYGDNQSVLAAWKASLALLLRDESSVVILGVCSDCGGGIMRGANWGPLYLRMTLHDSYPHLKALELGDVKIIPHLLHDKYLNETTVARCRKALYDDASIDLPVSPLSITEKVTNALYQQFPRKAIFAIGGDHSVSYPLVKSYIEAKKRQGRRVAIVHFDAHTDLLSERLGIDLCFGTWCAHILGLLHNPSDLIQIGIRASAKSKEHWQSTLGVKQFWASEIRAHGARSIAQTIKQHLQASDIDEIYVSFDIDAMDITLASATGTPEPGGLLEQDALQILQILSETYPITGADMMEIAPFVQMQAQSDIGGAEQTLKTGAKISAFLLQTMAQSINLQ